MYTFKTLENISMEVIHKAFVEAFSDYQVKMDLPKWKFENMLIRRGFTPELSMGAFKDDQLVGFVLNGLRTWDGKPTVYDLGTGVIGEYRKQGITSNILTKIRELLKEREIKQYLLEVLQINTSAVTLYQKQGFMIVRNFLCFRLDKKNYNQESSWKLENPHGISAADWKQFEKFWDYKPSWQNSIDSIKAVPDSFHYSVASINGIVVGYGVIDKRTGDIVQLAVSINDRCKGIGRSIMTDLLNHSESGTAGVLNVDDRDNDMKEFLLKLGFEESVSQYEMILELSR